MISVLGDRALAEALPCVEAASNGVVLEEGLTAVPYDGPFYTLEWVEGRDRSLGDEETNIDDSGSGIDEAWDDSWIDEEVYRNGSEPSIEYLDEWSGEDDIYYEDEWYSGDEYWDDSSYYEDEALIDDSWYDGDELHADETWSGEDYWDDSWDGDLEIPGDVYWDEAWSSEGTRDGEYEFAEAGGITWQDGDVWLGWDRSDVNVAPAPDDRGSSEGKIGGLTDLDDGMVYAMALAGGIAVPSTPAVPATPKIAETVPPLVVPTPETNAPADVAPVLPPDATTTEPTPPPDAAAPRVDESAEPPPSPILAQAEMDQSAPAAFAPPSPSDDHFALGESLELTADLRVG